MALYRAKSEGREVGAGSKQAWRHARKRAGRLELDLRQALETEAFELHYQPLANLKTRNILTCEALLRWPHPARGMVPSGVHSRRRGNGSYRRNR